MKYFALFDENGNRITTYVDEIHSGIPSEAIEITEQDQNLYITNEYIRGTDGRPAKKIITTEEIFESTKAVKLAEIKAKLSATDYKCLKFVDGELTAAEYSETKVLRSRLRAAYNTINDAKTIDEINAVNY